MGGSPRARRVIRWRLQLASWHPDGVLSQAEIDAFAADGYVAVRGAVPADVLRLCQDEIWFALGEHGVWRDDPSTWREPVVRIPCPETEAFAAAGSQPVLWEAFDQLIVPTRVRPGSHRDAARVLAPAGDEGMPFPQAAQLAARASAARPTQLATGQAGDVIVCHPFLVHAASWPHTGRHPRIMAQPGVALHDAFPLVPSLSRSSSRCGRTGPPDRDQLPDAPEDPAPPFAVRQLLPA